MRPTIALVLRVADVEASLRGVDMLARMCREARRDGYLLKLSDVQPELRELIELAGLSRLLLD